MPVSPAKFPGALPAQPLPRLRVETGNPRYTPAATPVTAVWSSGFENQVAAYTAAGNGLCNSATGTIGSATDQAHTGAASLKYQAAGAGACIDITASGAPSIMVSRSYHRFNALPTGANAIIVTCLVALQNCDIVLTTGGVLQAQVETGTAVSGPTINTGQWYRIDARFDLSKNPTRIDWMVDGVQQSAATLAQAATTISFYRLGPTTNAATLTGWIDDAIISTTASDYPIGPGYSKIFTPNGKGTHVPGAGAFQTDAAAAITDANDAAGQSWLRLDEQPPNATDFITQTAADTNGYLEYALTDSAEGNQPNSVSVFFASHAASAASCDISIKTNDNGTITAGSTNTMALTSEFYSLEVLARRPSTGLAWTEDALSNLLLRAGYAADATPNPRIDAVWVEVDYAGVVSTSVATTQNITDTGVTQTDALQTTRVRFIADTGATQTDSLATIRVRVITDTGVTQSDAAGRGVPRAVTDTGVSQTDTVATTRRRVVADTGVSQTDSVVRAVRRIVSDTGVTNTDTVATKRVRVVVDYAFTEVFPGSATFPGATLFPGGTISDSVATIRRRGLTDTGVTQTDTVATTRRRIVTDTGVTQSDSVSRAFPRSVTDTGVSQTDSVVATHGGVTGVTDTGVTQSDTVATTRTRSFADTGATITDSVATTRRRVLSDTGLVQSDSVSATRSALRAVTDTGVSQTDSVTATAVHPRNIIDIGATVSDAVSSTRRHVVTDTGASVTDSVTTTRVRFIADTGVSQSDTVTPATVRPRFVIDTGATITDSVVRTASSTHTYRSFTGYATQTGWAGTAAQTGWTATPTRTYATGTAAQNDLAGIPSQTGIVGAVAL